MAGTGKAAKPFYINIGDEETAFGTEAATKYAVPGSIADLPTLQAHNETIFTQRHSEVGKYNKVLKGGEISSISYNLNEILNWRHLAHIFQNRIERERKLELSGVTGTPADNETVTGGTSGATAQSETSSSWDGSAMKWTLIQFTKGETITGGTSGATGTLEQIKGDLMILSSGSGTFQADEDVTGGTSGARANISSVNSFDLTLKSFQDAETVTGGTSGATGTIDEIYYQHQLSFNNYLDQESKTIVYVPVSLSNQWVLLGSELDKMTIASAWQEEPNMNCDWLISNSTLDSTIDAEVALTGSTAPYEFTDLDLTINGNDFSALFKTINQEFDTEKASTPTHDSLNPAGYTSKSLMSKLTLGVWREDASIHNLRINDTNFPVIVTYTRGTDDNCTFTYSNCKSLKPTDKEEDNKYMTDIEVEVEGTPTAVVNDLIPEYD